MTTIVPIFFTLLSIQHLQTHGFPTKNRNRQPQPRIANGIPTTPDKFPWIVSLRMFVEWWKNDTLVYSNDWHSCTGTLIRSDFPAAVLTAAHCYEDYIREGPWGIEEIDWWVIAQFNRTDATPTDNQTIETFIGYSVTKIVNHPYYWIDLPYQMSTINDTAVLFLNDSVDIEPIKLNNDSNPAQCCSKGDKLTVIGYGSEELWQTPTDTLEYAQMTYVEDDQCNEEISDFLRYSNASYITNLTDYLKTIDIDIETADYPWNILGSQETIICAEPVGDDEGAPCSGDSGGPLISGSDSDGIQVGISAFVWECSKEYGDYGVPSGFMDVSMFYGWIQEVLDENPVIDFDLETTNFDQGNLSTKISFSWFGVMILFYQCVFML